jgi:hypothetical protein
MSPSSATKLASKDKAFLDSQQYYTYNNNNNNNNKILCKYIKIWNKIVINRQSIQQSIQLDLLEEIEKIAFCNIQKCQTNTKS